MALTAEQIKKILENPASAVKEAPTVAQGGTSSPYLTSEQISQIMQEADSKLAAEGKTPTYTYKDLKTQAEKNWASVGQNIVQGLGDASAALAKTGKAVSKFDTDTNPIRRGINKLVQEGYNLLPEDARSGLENLGVDPQNPQDWLYDITIKSNQHGEKLTQQANAQADESVQMINNWLVRPVANALPNTVFALMTGGSSTAAQLGTQSAGLVGQLSTQLLKNPQFYASAVQTFGPTYYDALENGATDQQAMWTALLNSALGSVIEVGATPDAGGLETFLKSEGKGFLDFVKSIPEEGSEEVLQGILERFLQKTVAGDEGTKWFSADPNQEAVFNPSTSAQEFAGGAIVGGVLGGTTYTVNAVVNNVNKVKSQSGLDYATLAQNTAQKVGIEETVAAEVAEIAKATKTPVVWVDAIGNTADGGVINGVFKDNVMVLAANGTGDKRTVAAHELTHSIEGTAAYQNIVNEIAVDRKNNNAASLDAEAAGIQALYREQLGMDITIEQAKAEAVARYVEQRLDTSPAVLAALRSYNGGVFARMLQNRRYNQQYKAADEATRQQLRLQRNVAEGIRQRPRTNITPEQIRAVMERVQNESKIREIMERLNRGDVMSVDEVENTPQIIQAITESEAIPSTADINTPEREKLRREIGNKLLQLGSFTGVDESGKEVYNGNVKQNRRVDIVIGLPAAGKSSVLVNPLSRDNESRVVDSDMAKEQLPEFNKGIGANAVHIESQRIIEELVLKNAISRGDNIVYPIVGGGPAQNLLRKISKFKNEGYTVYLHLNELPNNKAIARAIGRYLKTGRFLRPHLIFSYGDTPTQNFYKVLEMEGIVNEGNRNSALSALDLERSRNTSQLNERNEPVEPSGMGRGTRFAGTISDRVTRSTGKLIDGYSHYSNDVDLWQKPILIAELNTRTGVEQGDALVDSGIFIPKNKKNNDPYSISSVTDELLKPYIEKYGGMKLPNREIETPVAVDDSGRKVSQAASTYLNATDDQRMVQDTAESILKGAYNYTPQSIKDADTEANAYIEAEGYEKVAAEASILSSAGIGSTETSPELFVRYKVLLKQALANGDYDTAQNCQVAMFKMVSDSAKIMRFQLDVLLKGVDGKRQAQLTRKNVEKMNKEVAEKATKERGQVPQETIEKVRKQRDQAQAEGNKKAVKKFNAELQKLGAGVTVSPELMSALENAKTQEEIDLAKANIYQHIADQLPPTAYEQFMSWRYLAMLFNPKTWIKNEVGNLSNLGLHKLDNLVAYAYQRAFLKEGNKIVAFRWKHTELGKMLESKINTAADTATAREGSHKYDDVKDQVEELRRTFNNDALEKTAGVLDTALNEGAITAITGGKLKIGAGDRPMFRQNYIDALGNYMVSNGLTEVTAEADAWATKVAQDYVFHTQNAAAQALTKLRNSGKLGRVAVDSLMPFIRTPANVLAQGLQRSPIGFAVAGTKLVKAAIAQKQGKGSVSPELINSMARASTGTVMFILGVIASAIGLATGKEEGEDAKGRIAGELAGAQDLSIRIPGTDTRISFDWLEPASYPFLVGVLMNDGFESENPWGSLLDAASAGYSQVFDMSMLSGLLDAFTSNYDDGSQMVAQAVGAVFENAVTQSIPTLVGQLARSIDPVKRKTTSGESWVTDTFGDNFASDTISTVLARIPGASTILEPERDVFGNEVGRVGDTENWMLNAFQQVLSPAAITRKGDTDTKTDEVTQILLGLYESTGQGKVIPSEIKAKDFKEKLSDEGLADKYTSKLYQETREDVGQAQLEALWEMIDKNLSVELTETYTTAAGKEKRRTYSKRFDDMTEEEKVKAIAKTANEAKEITLEDLLDNLSKGANAK